MSCFSVCVGEQTTIMSRLRRSIRLVCTCTFCAGVLEIYTSPLSLTTRTGSKRSASLYRNFD